MGKLGGRKQREGGNPCMYKTVSWKITTINFKSWSWCKSKTIAPLVRYFMCCEDDIWHGKQYAKESLDKPRSLEQGWDAFIEPRNRAGLGFSNFVQNHFIKLTLVGMPLMTWRTRIRNQFLQTSSSEWMKPLTQRPFGDTQSNTHTLAVGYQCLSKPLQGADSRSKH